jgi:DNA modification methylase
MVKAWKEYNKLPERVKKTLKPLNDLAGSEWAQLSKSINTFNGGIAKKRKNHGAAYPISLAKHLIKIYTHKGDTVLDPFVGVGTTLDAAQLLGRNGIGFDTNHEFIELAKKGIDPIDISEEDIQYNVKISLYEETCLNLMNYIKPESVDFVLTSPPYSNLLNNTVEKFGGSYYYKNIYKD